MNQQHVGERRHYHDDDDNDTTTSERFGVSELDVHGCLLPMKVVHGNEGNDVSTRRRMIQKTRRRTSRTFVDGNKKIRNSSSTPASILSKDDDDNDDEEASSSTILSNMRRRWLWGSIRLQQRQRQRRRRRKSDLRDVTSNATTINNNDVDDDNDDDDNIHDGQYQHYDMTSSYHEEKKQRTPTPFGELLAWSFLILIVLNVTIFASIIGNNDYETRIDQTTNENTYNYYYIADGNPNRVKAIDDNRRWSSTIRRSFARFSPTSSAFSSSPFESWHGRFLQDGTTDNPADNITSSNETIVVEDQTFDPTFIPTVVETIVNSESPSDSPTSTPTTSMSPSLSAMPSFLPSSVPSMVPSIVPSAEPTTTFRPTSPTSSPSISFVPTISLLPSSTPTFRPTMAPSVSTEPSGSPIQPSNQPSISMLPSLMPSFQPSPAPTISSRPSAAPTVSLRPSVSSQPSMVPSITPSDQPSQAPQVPTESPTESPTNFPYESPEIVMVLNGFPKDGDVTAETIFENEEQRLQWENITSEHVKQFHMDWLNAILGIGGGGESDSPSSSPTPATSTINETLVPSDVNRTDGTNLTTMMPVLRQSSSSSSVASSFGSTKQQEQPDQPPLSSLPRLPPVVVYDVETVLIGVRDTGEEGTWTNTTVYEFIYNQTIIYTIVDDSLLNISRCERPGDSPPSSGGGGEGPSSSSVQARQDDSPQGCNEDDSDDDDRELLNEFLVLYPFKADSFDYIANLVTEFELQDWLILEEIDIVRDPTIAPTSPPNAPPPDDEARTYALSASIVFGACIIVAFLMWDRHRKNARMYQDEDDDDDDDDVATGANDYDTADFDNAGQPVDWTNPYSDPGVSSGVPRSGTAGAVVGAAALGGGMQSSGHYVRPPGSRTGSSDRRSEHLTAALNDGAGREGEGSNHMGTVMTVGTLSTVASSAGPTPQGTSRTIPDRNRERGRHSSTSSNLPPLPPLSNSDHVRTSYGGSTNESTTVSSNGLRSSGVGNRVGPFGSPIPMRNSNLRQTSITDTELTDVTYSDGFHMSDRGSDAGYSNHFQSLNDQISSNKYRYSDNGLPGSSHMGITDNGSTPFSPLHIPDEEALEMGEGLSPPSSPQHNQPMLGLSSNADFTQSQQQPSDHQQSPQITGFVMQIEELE